MVKSWSHSLWLWAFAASASAAANAPDAASSWPGSTCEYSMSVTVGLAWPMRWLTSFGLAPEVISHVAAECRNPCGPIRGSPAASHRSRKRDVIHCSHSGLPASPVNT